jgi:hypothetical protein
LNGKLTSEIGFSFCGHEIEERWSAFFDHSHLCLEWRYGGDSVHVRVPKKKKEGLAGFFVEKRKDEKFGEINSAGDLIMMKRLLYQCL